MTPELTAADFPFRVFGIDRSHPMVIVPVVRIDDLAGGGEAEPGAA